MKRLWKVIGKDEQGIGHSVIVDRIKPDSWVLDAGCRRYDFVEAILELERGCRVIAVDPDPAAEEDFPNTFFVQAALLAKPKKSTTIHLTKDPSTYYIKEPRYRSRKQDLEGSFEAKVVTIPQLMKQFKVKEFSVVKLDIEGSEYDILMNWPGPIADQITVEFHDAYPGRNPYPDPEQYYNRLFEHLGQWYDIIRHTKSGPMWARNYWDSLFVRR